MNTNTCYLCGSKNLEILCILNKKPHMETDFNIPYNNYNRIICKCNKCKVYNNFHDYESHIAYSGVYNKATYSNLLLNKYNQIMEMSFDKSDNKQRVSRIIQFLGKYNLPLNTLRILDVGSGLGVFIGQLIKYGVEAHCIDPDPISVAHTKKNIGVQSAHLGKFEDFRFGKKFDLITFNKVLEHVTNPVGLLKKSKFFLKNNGIIYLELPDGKRAVDNGGFLDREEFFIEHFTIFDEESLIYFINQAGVKIISFYSVHEPSDKYTLCAFLKL